MWSVFEAAGFLLPSSFVFLGRHCFEPGSAQLLGEVAFLASTPRGTSLALSTCTCADRESGQTRRDEREVWYSGTPLIGFKLPLRYNGMMADCSAPPV